MFNDIKNFLNNILFIHKELPNTNDLEEINLDKTDYYKKEFETFYIDRVLISLRYDEKSKLLIENYKYKGHKSLNNIFSEYLKKTFELLLDKENIKTKEIIITGTPLFFFDFLKRGYNHSYILAKNLNSDKHKFLRIFIKKRSTVPQAKLKKQERIRNLKNAFAIRKKYNQFIKGKTLLIVDDVISTGSTANNLAKLLKDSGAKKVYGLFLATGV